MVSWTMSTPVQVCDEYEAWCSEHCHSTCELSTRASHQCSSGHWVALFEMSPRRGYEVPSRKPLKVQCHYQPRVIGFETFSYIHLCHQHGKLIVYQYIHIKVYVYMLQFVQANSKDKSQHRTAKYQAAMVRKILTFLE